MGLDRVMYEKVKTTFTGELSPAMDAYAEAYFSEPPITGEWTEAAMREEFHTLLRNHHFGSIDLRYRSAESILRERLQSAREHVESAELDLELVSGEYKKLLSFIHRFHLEKLYEEYLKNLRTGTPSQELGPEELPFD